MEYREINQADYDRKLRLVVVGAEGLHAHVQNVGDGRATIGWGYTLNRSNNVAIWRASGIQLTQGQWQTLAAVDAARSNEEKTRIGLTFTRQVNAEESDRLLRASMAEYEAPANSLNMPLSDEKVAMVSLAYNRGVGNLTGAQGRNVPEHPVMDAIRNGDRAEAWFQMRYNRWGSDKLDQQYPNAGSNEAGLRKRRFAEAEVFGLYDDPNNVTPEQARDVYRAFQLHRDEVDRVEREFGVTVDGDEARQNRIAQANRDYPELVNEYRSVSTIADAIAPARNALLQDLRRRHPEMAHQFTDTSFNAGRIYLDPGRDLQDAPTVDRTYPGNNRTHTAVRREQSNASVQNVDLNHAEAIDSQHMTRGQNPQEIPGNDLLIGEGGNDTLRAHRGDDILIGGQGRDRMEGGDGHDIYVIGAGDTVRDSDGRGEVRWNGQRLMGGTRSESDPANAYRSADGRFTYTLEGDNLRVAEAQATDQALREGAVIESFRDGQIGITLTGPGRVAQARQDAGSMSASLDGDTIRALQTNLRQLGFTDMRGRPHASDGDYGFDTQMAVTAFQREHGLPANGVADAATLKLVEAVATVARLQPVSAERDMSAVARAQQAPEPSTPISPRPTPTADWSRHDPRVLNADHYATLKAKFPQFSEEQLTSYTAAIHKAGIPPNEPLYEVRLWKNGLLDIDTAKAWYPSLTLDTNVPVPSIPESAQAVMVHDQQRHADRERQQAEIAARGQSGPALS